LEGESRLSLFRWGVGGVVVCGLVSRCSNCWQLEMLSCICVFIPSIKIRHTFSVLSKKWWYYWELINVCVAIHKMIIKGGHRDSANDAHLYDHQDPLALSISMCRQSLLMSLLCVREFVIKLAITYRKKSDKAFAGA
jgi:hypothetical protein